MHDPLVPSPVRVEVDPEERIALDGSESDTAVCMFKPRLPRSLLFRILRCARTGSPWRLDIRKMRLAACALVLQNSKETGDPVPTSSLVQLVPASWLWPLVPNDKSETGKSDFAWLLCLPVVVNIESLTCGISYQLRRANLIADRIEHAPHELFCSA